MVSITVRWFLGAFSMRPLHRVYYLRLPPTPPRCCIALFRRPPVDAPRVEAHDSHDGVGIRVLYVSGG